MAWFSLRRTTEVPMEPQYSELGAEIYRILEEFEEEWEVYEGHLDRVHGVFHRRTNIYIHIDAHSRSVYAREGLYSEGVPSLSRLLTHDDTVRIGDRARKLMETRSRHRQHEEMKRALERIKPNPFDADCRALARAVLSGDATAARPLLDRCMERVMESG